MDRSTNRIDNAALLLWVWGFRKAQEGLNVSFADLNLGYMGSSLVILFSGSL